MDAGVYLWGQSCLDDAQRIFACFDQPDLKASIRLSVDAPDGWTVVANARGTQQGSRWVFAATERISTYLFTVAAGPWHSVYRDQDGRQLGLHCRRSLAPHLDADVEELFEVTSQSFGSRSSCSVGRTRSATPTTSCSCPSSTTARWRTPVPSPSPRSSCSAHG